MLTPQEVSSHAFTKAVMGGYNMAMVDEFLDELTDDYTALYKENAALKAKLKVLVEKVEDYRATEDSMRATLLTAQKMADSIVREAETKRDEMLAQAETDAQIKIGQLQREIDETQARLDQGREELAHFMTAIRETCRKEMELLDRLPELPVAVSAAAAPERQEEKAVEEIEESVLAAFSPDEAAQSQEDAPQQETAPEETYPEGDPFAPPEDKSDEPTRRISMDRLELEFGPNYKGGR